MKKRVYYGSFQNQRKRDKKKKFLILITLIIAIGAIVWFTVFLGAARRSDVGDVVKDSIQEITQLKLQLKEKDDQIALLNDQIAYYETELAARPTPSPTPIPAPNEEVLAGQPTPMPSPKPSRAPRKSVKPSSTSETVSPAETVPEDSQPANVQTDISEDVPQTSIQDAE